MTPQSAKLALGIAGALFIAFLLFKLFRPAAPPGPERREARRRFSEARREAREPSQASADRAAAWRRAARIALDELKRPNLAASCALKAEKQDPGDAEAVAVLAASLRSASRLRALETILWRRLAHEEQAHGPAYERAFRELVDLYEGPMRKPERAEVLRRLSATDSESHA